MVPVKRVIDHNVKIQALPDGLGIDANGVKMSVNPFDETALEEAVRLKERGIATEVIAVSIGGEKCREQLITAMAMGADRAILVKLQHHRQQGTCHCEEAKPTKQSGLSPRGSGLLPPDQIRGRNDGSDSGDRTLNPGRAKTENTPLPLQVAGYLKAIAEKEKPQLVITGKQAIDDDACQTGQMLAGLLDWPQGTFVSKIDVQDKNLLVVRETDEGRETLELTIPAVITADLRFNEPRKVSLPAVLKARKMPVEIIPASSLEVISQPAYEVLKISEPPARKKGIMVTSVDELLDRLRNEAGVL
jgi:electron transfer flavoprotein beta subunit